MSDLIERQKAIDALRKMQTYKLFSGDDMLLIDQAGAMTELMLLPSAEPQTCFGYDVIELVIFAHACRKAGIDEKNLHDFVLSCETAYAYVLDEMRAAQDKAIKQCLERMEVDNEHS